MLRRTLQVDLDELETAFEDHGYETQYYLDLQTGDVAVVQDEFRSDLDKILDDLPDNSESGPLDWPRLAEEHGLPDWEAVILEEAYRVERDVESRYIAVPKDESHDAYQDMADFVETVEDARLRDRLDHAIAGRGAFGRFKDALGYNDAERKRWFAFKHEHLCERIMKWLELNGIDATPRR